MRDYSLEALHDFDRPRLAFFLGRATSFLSPDWSRERGITITHGGGAGREHEPVLKSVRGKAGCAAEPICYPVGPIRSRAEEEADISREMNNGCGTRGGRRRQ